MPTNETSRNNGTDDETQSAAIDWESIARTEIFMSLTGATNDLEGDVQNLAHQVADGDDITHSDVWGIRRSLKNLETDLRETLDPIVVDGGDHDDTVKKLLRERDFVACRLFELTNRARTDRLRSGDVAAVRELLSETDEVLADLESELAGGSDDD